MNEEDETLDRVDGPDSAATKRLSLLVDAHADFVWRSLRRLGVPSSIADDATQQVFVIVQQRLSSIETARERSFLFGVAMNVAAHVRRGLARRREVESESLAHLGPRGDGANEVADPTPLADDQLDRHRARALLDSVLDAMSVDLRTVFVLFEMEEMTMAEIADTLGCPQGTVASRLRRARDEFHKHAQRVRADMERRRRRTFAEACSPDSKPQPPPQPSSTSEAVTTLLKSDGGLA